MSYDLGIELGATAKARKLPKELWGMIGQTHFVKMDKSHKNNTKTGGSLFNEIKTTSI